ncbi:MAG: GNAT family N-acetyltransferase [Sphingomonadales bacterium]|nr:GNAT family N-acetyltransferase [Sphingomonadales bacterium]PIX67689.1 MAG: cellulose biosynthesis protein CelD [Sphingomonadales bacterium CG_4_10_14_3_um_filter_58_15]NCO47752.1 GNAT family N-acetyltransferase [Sphingomonadales bacterium]NCO99703.1 GNAT family N-acetyltransferase [Sphingomonadales bacterium]NCP43364.1 GNAT family N-acetyltransferase [Sphingomonadales bacterium]
MDLSGLQKMEGKDIGACRLPEGLSEFKYRALFHPVPDIDDRLIAAWTDLAKEASEPNIYYEHWFLRPALAALDHHPDLRLFLLWAAEPGQSQLLGLLPIGPASRFGRWPVPHIQNWMHHNCFLGTPLVRKGFEKNFWEQLLIALDGSAWLGFLHINGMTIGGPLDQAMRAVCASQKRRCDLVHSEARAFLQSTLGSEAYFQATVRGKKRKELRRQAKRLDELGEVTYHQYSGAEGLDQWIDEFLHLEKTGWKGLGGSALDSSEQTREFFRDALIGAARAGQLERYDIRLEGTPLAMLVNFHSGHGSFSFKTAFDEAFSRFSPGVLLQLENLKILENRSIAWMDSCAAEDHPMIDSIWSGRRHIGRFSIELKGVPRRAVFRGLRLGERLMGTIKGRTIFDPTEGQQ